MNAQELRELVNHQWDSSILPRLIDYIRIPNKSTHFDAYWREHGHMDAAVALAEQWCREQPVAGMSIEVVRLPGRTPLLYIDVPGDVPGVVPRNRVGCPDLIICLDSGCGNYEQLWCTTSLRGLVGGNLVVEVLTEGVHSGDASGIVPSSFRIARQLLNRLEDVDTGRVLPAGFYAKIPAERVEQAAQAAQVLGDSVYFRFPYKLGMHPVSENAAELILNRTWRPALSVTGAAGLPAPAQAGNVLRPMTTLKLSLRLPPTCDATVAAMHLKSLLERDTPYGATARFEADQASSGWNAPALKPWLATSVNQASTDYFGKPAMFMGEGGTIPFMAMLGQRFPKAQFLITGVLGPQSNAHGPNEFLHIPTAKRLTCCVAQVIADHWRHRREAVQDSGGTP